MPEQTKQIVRYERPAAIRVASTVDERHALWINALAGTLSFLEGKRMNRCAIWKALFLLTEKDRPDIQPVYSLPENGKPLITFLDVKTESRLNSLEEEFRKRHPVIPVSDALYIRSLVAHFATQETPHACAKRCIEALSASR